MIKKNSFMLLFVISSLICSYAISMEEEGGTQHAFARAIEIVDKMRETHLTAVKHKNRDHCLSNFAQAMIEESRVDEGFGKIVNDEAMQQTIVSRVRLKIQLTKTEISDHYVAEKLAHYIPEYAQICTGIQEAFRPDGKIKNPWYANATKLIPRKDDKFEWGWWFDGEQSPLLFAVGTANIDWCQKLIAAGADVKKMRLDGTGLMRSILFEAVYLRKESKQYERRIGKKLCKIIFLLLKSGACADSGVQYRTGDENTFVRPLQQAIADQDEEIVRLLLLYGAKTEGISVEHTTRQWYESLNLPKCYSLSDEKK